MKRFVFLVLLTLLLFDGHAVRAQSAEYTPTITQVDDSAYPEVTVYVRVEDTAGEIVEGLTQDDFALWEDGTSAEITAFSPSVVGGVTAVLTLDRSTSMERESKFRGAKRAATAYVDLMRGQDRTAIVAFDKFTEVVESFTADQAQLRQSIDQLQTGACTAIYDGVFESVSILQEQQGRRLIILVTDGIDCREVPDAEDEGSQHTLDESIEHARQAELPVHVIGLGNRNTQDIVDGIDEVVLQRIANETGGEYYYTPSPDQLEELYESIAVETQNEYVLTYTSPRDVPDGTVRDIEIDVGGQTTSETYVEKHLLNIESSFTVGAVLLLGLLLFLFAPAVFLRLRRPQQPTIVPPAYQQPPYQQPPTPPPVQPPPPQVPAPLPDQPPVQQPPLPPPHVYQSPPVEAAQMPCPNCGQMIRPNAKFCQFCGQGTQPTTCRECQRPLRPGAKFCAACGTKQ